MAQPQVTYGRSSVKQDDDLGSALVIDDDSQRIADNSMAEDPARSSTGSADNSRANLSDEEKETLLLGAIRDQESNSYGNEGDSQLAHDRARSIDDYLGKPYGNEVEGRSQVVSRDVYDTIEWIKPSLLRIFTSGDQVAKFDPIGPEDEKAAEQESDYINYVIQEKNPWFNLCYEWFTDALMTKNAYALAYWDTTKQVERDTYEGITDEQFQMLVNEDGVEVIEHSEYPNEPAMKQQQAMIQQMVAMAAQQGQQIAPPDDLPQPMLHDVVIRRTKEYKGVKMCVLPPERVMVSENTGSMSVKDSDFFEFWEMKSISELRKMGFDVPDDIADDYAELEGEEDQARDVYQEDMLRNLEGANDPSMRKVCFRMVWIKYDYDGDGIAERRHVQRVGSTVFYNEECHSVPVGALVPTPMPHRHPGLSVRDMVTDLQEIKTAIWRGGLDNLYLANNGRYGVSDKVNLSDMLNSRPGGLVRVKDNGIPGQEIFPFTHPVTIGPALQMMEYTDQIRQQRTGTSAAFTGVDPNALSKAHSGIAISQLTSSAAQRVEMIARVFAEGVKELFQVVHELCIKHGHEAEVIKLRNEWVTVNPSQWKRRSDMKLSVGLGTGNKEQLMQNLMVIYSAQKELLPLGITTPEKIFNTMAELSKAAGFASQEKFWEQPKEGPMPQPPNPEVIKAQAAMQGKQMEIQATAQAKDREIAAQAQADERKAQQDMQQEQLRSTNDMTIQREKIASEAALEKYKADLAAETELKIAAINAQVQMAGFNAKDNVDAVVSGLAEAVNMQDKVIRDIAAVTQGINQAAALMTAPRRVVRDAKGRAIGLEIAPNSNGSGGALQ